MTKARILVVEDDPAITFGLRTNLAFEGYQVEVADTRAGAVAAATSAPPDLIVLDLMLPDGSGFEVMEELRRGGYTGRILVLSARLEETDKVTALRMGADDYVTKPFSLAELLARVGALLRRPAVPAIVSPPVDDEALHPAAHAHGNLHGAAPAPRSARGNGATGNGAAGSDGGDTSRLRFGACAIDLVARTLTVDDKPVFLTRLEFDLLVFFARNPGRALTRAQLLRDVWGLPHEGSARTVDNVIAHLREKLGEDAEKPRHLLTLRGAGYRFELFPVDKQRRKK